MDGPLSAGNVFLFETSIFKSMEKNRYFTKCVPSQVQQLKLFPFSLDDYLRGGEEGICHDKAINPKYPYFS